jgi:hypothetical protein
MQFGFGVIAPIDQSFAGSGSASNVVSSATALDLVSMQDEFSMLRRSAASRFLAWESSLPDNDGA